MIRWLAAAFLFALLLPLWFFGNVIDPYRDVEFGTLRPGVPEFVESASGFALMLTGLIAATLFSDPANRRGRRLWLTAPPLLFFAATAGLRLWWILFQVPGWR